MRKILSSMLVMSAFTVAAQTEDDVPTARVLALDTSVTGARAFNNELARQLTGFSPAFVDTTNPKTVVSMYKNSTGEGLKIEFKYKNVESDDGQVQSNKQVVHYQRITATDATMSRIFNYIFNTNIQPEHLRALTSTGSSMKYKSGTYMYILDQSEYRPGYWELTFVR